MELLDKIMIKKTEKAARPAICFQAKYTYDVALSEPLTVLKLKSHFVDFFINFEHFLVLILLFIYISSWIYVLIFTSSFRLIFIIYKVLI